MGKLMRNMLVMAKDQTALGTPATLAAASNAVLVRSAMPSVVDGAFVKRELIRVAMGNYGSDMAEVYRTLEMEVELAGSGAAGTKPGVSPLLLGCRMTETVSAGTSVAYAPATSSPKYLTMECDLDGSLFKLQDAIGNLSLNFDAGQYPTMKMNFIGAYQTMTDRAMPTGAVFTTQKKPLVVNKLNTPTFTLAGLVLPTASFSLDLGADVYWRELVNLSGAEMNDRSPTARLRVELGTVAAKNWGESIRTGEEMALSILHGTVAGNRVGLSCPKLVVNAKPTISDDRGVAMLELSFDVTPTNGNDEFTLTYT